MKNNWKKALCFACTLLFTLSVSAACNLGGGTSNESSSVESSPQQDLGERVLSGFEVEKTTDVGELGSVYNVEEVAPVDNYGKFYDVAVSVKKDGQEVLLIGGAFALDALGEYDITYQTEFKGETLTKTTKVTVTDTIAPIIESKTVFEKIKQGDSVNLSGITARDWSDVKTLTKTVWLGEQEITVKDDTFIATESGVYTVKVAATDNAANTAESVFLINCLDKGELYNFDAPVSAAEIYGATTMEYVDTLPEGNVSGGLKMTFANNWQTLLFRDVSSKTLAKEKENGFNTLFFDVYYEGEDNERIWVTAFGAGAKNMRANEWTTFEIPLSSFESLEKEFNYMAFNVDVNAEYPYPQSSYNVYLDNIRVAKVVEKEKLYGGFENDTLENQGWKYIAWFSNIQVFTAQTDVVYDGMKSLKVTSSTAQNYFHLTNGAGQTKLDGEWIAQNAGKTLSFWVYYKNDNFATDTLSLSVQNNTSGDAACSAEITQGEWTQVIVNIDDMQAFSLITVLFKTDNLSSGAVYFDLFEVYEAE